MSLEQYLTSMDLSTTPKEEIKVISCLVLIGVGIAVISYLIAFVCNDLLQLDKTLELTNILATSILGSGAIAIAAVEFTKKPQ